MMVSFNQSPYSIPDSHINEMETKLKNCDKSTLQHKLQAVESDIKNLEEELDQREELLAFIEELINKRRLST
jgi:hypothetical protein